MYVSKINIKHNRSSEIHWGVHKLTNRIVWIDDVEGNGYACNCKCACCGADLKACTQGNVQQHHFKHRGNNDCYYSNEIAEYLKAKDILSTLNSIWVPPTTVRIGNRPQIIQIAEQRSISISHCSYDANHYPPLLIADINARPTRVILSFSGYYNKKDYTELIEDARENNWDCLEVMLPRKNDGIIITEELLFKYVSETNPNKRWVFSAKSHDYFVQLKNASRRLAPRPAKYGSIDDVEYECPLHKRESKGSFYAYKKDCEECDFWLDFKSEYCRCLGPAGVKTLTDLDIPENIRKEQFLTFRQENEAKIRGLSNMVAEKECDEKQLCPYCGRKLQMRTGKNVVYRSCLTLNCGFFEIEDNTTGEIKVIHNDNEAKYNDQSSI